jgi:hypothetical protein
MEESDDLSTRISELLLAADPMRIYFEDFENTDEYDAEARELALLLPTCTSRIACLGVAQGVFRKYFGDLIVSRDVNWDDMADRLWELRRARFGS